MAKIDHENKKLELSEIADRLQLPQRTLRYVVDNCLVKGLRVTRRGRGQPRQLAVFDAAMVAAAAALLESGLSTARVEQIIEQCRGARRVNKAGMSAPLPFWAGLKLKRDHWYFGSSFCSVSLDLGTIYTLLKES